MRLQINDGYWKGLTRKDHVENDFIWKPQLYVGFSLRGSRHEDINLIEAKAQSWLNRLASYTSDHCTMDLVTGYDKGVVHCHGAVLSPTSIKTRLAKSLWHDGYGSFRKYNSDLGGVIYNHVGHVDAHMLGYVACPRHNGACKRKKCPFQTGRVPILKS